MSKYKCNNCGHEFEGDLSTQNCPACGNTNIQKKDNTKNIIIMVEIVVIILLLFKYCSGTTC